MRERGEQYLVGMPKKRLNRLEADLAACDWQQASEQARAKLLPPAGGAVRLQLTSKKMIFMLSIF